MSYRNGKRQTIKCVKQKREVKPFNCDEEQVIKLMGMVIQNALEDYFAKIPKIKKDMTYYQIGKINRLNHNKATAKNFFEKSRLFELTGLSFDYLKLRYKKGR